MLISPKLRKTRSAASAWASMKSATNFESYVPRIVRNTWLQINRLCPLCKGDVHEMHRKMNGKKEKVKSYRRVSRPEPATAPLGPPKRCGLTRQAEPPGRRMTSTAGGSTNPPARYRLRCKARCHMTTRLGLLRPRRGGRRTDRARMQRSLSDAEPLSLEGNGEDGLYAGGESEGVRSQGCIRRLRPSEFMGSGIPGERQRLKKRALVKKRVGRLTRTSRHPKVRSAGSRRLYRTANPPISNLVEQNRVTRLVLYITVQYVRVLKHYALRTTVGSTYYVRVVHACTHVVRMCIRTYVVLVQACTVQGGLYKLVQACTSSYNLYKLVQACQACTYRGTSARLQAVQACTRLSKLAQACPTHLRPCASWLVKGKSPVRRQRASLTLSALALRTIRRGLEHRGARTQVTSHAQGIPSSALDANDSCHPFASLRDDVHGAVRPVNLRRFEPLYNRVVAPTKPRMVPPSHLHPHLRGPTN